MAPPEQLRRLLDAVPERQVLGAGTPPSAITSEPGRGPPRYCRPVWLAIDGYGVVTMTSTGRVVFEAPRCFGTVTHREEIASNYR